MPWDSLVRTKQLHKPELSGYIVDVLLQYLKTGAVTGIAMNTGQLTGQFYPLRQNPSGYVTTGQLTGYATQLQVTGNNTYIQSWVDINYYPRSTNPSGYVGTGFIATGLMPKSGAAFGKTESFTLYSKTYQSSAFAYRPDNYFIIRDEWYQGMAPDGAIINLTPGDDGHRPYISGFNIWTTGFNGEAALSSGDIDKLYVSRDYFDENHLDYAHSLPFVLFYNNNVNYNGPALLFGKETFLLNGGLAGALTDKYFIDMLGMSAPFFGMTYTRPLIYGFDINTSNITVTGFPVLTKDDLSGLATKQELYVASGELNDDIWRLRTEMMDMLTGSGGA